MSLFERAMISDKSFIFLKCCICRRLNVKLDGIDKQHLDGCFHNSHKNEYKIQ
jgi:hypothetical protein